MAYVSASANLCSHIEGCSSASWDCGLEKNSTDSHAAATDVSTWDDEPEGGRRAQPKAELRASCGTQGLKCIGVICSYRGFDLDTRIEDGYELAIETMRAGSGLQPQSVKVLSTVQPCKMYASNENLRTSVWYHCCRRSISREQR